MIQRGRVVVLAGRLHYWHPVHQPARLV